jgi:hypothetical protein
MQGEFPLWITPVQRHSSSPPGGNQPLPVQSALLRSAASAYGWFPFFKAGGSVHVPVRAWLSGTQVGSHGCDLSTQRSSSSSAVFPMIIAGAVWLPLTLLMAENIIQQRPLLRGRSSRALVAVDLAPWLQYPRWTRRDHHYALIILPLCRDAVSMAVVEGKKT